MDAGRYFETNPGDWFQLDRFSSEILHLDLNPASWINLTMSGARGRLNTRIDTVVTFPNFARTQRLYSCQSYLPMSKNAYPKESSIAERHMTTHFELQKSLPSDENETEGPQLWSRAFEPGFLVQVGQKGQKPIDTDFILRISKKSRIKMYTNPYSSGFSMRVNDVTLSYQLDTEKLNYEMGLSTANELYARFVRLATPNVSLAAEIYSKHYPSPKGAVDPETGKKSRGHTDSSATIALRFSTLKSPSSGSLPSENTETKDVHPFPVEIVASTNIGQHYGVSAAAPFFNDRIAFAFNWKRKWRGSQQKIALGLRFKWSMADVPSVLKLTASTHAGFAAFFGIRLNQCLGIGFGASINPNTSKAKAALFFDV
jgi:hypothetical protein